MKLHDQIHAPGAIPPGKNTQETGNAHPRTGQDAMAKRRGKSSNMAGTAAVQPSTVTTLLELSGSFVSKNSYLSSPSGRRGPILNWTYSPTHAEEYAAEIQGSVLST
jgi:hypothetical protein